MVSLKVISLYTGAGGLDLGLEAAGFEVAVAVEIDPEAVATLHANRDWLVLEKNIHDVPSEELLRAGGLQKGEADLLVGGPPCQPFSKSGYWCRGDSKRLDDPRAKTLDAYLRVLRDTKPKAFLLENVPGLTFNQKDEGLVFLEETIERINRDIGTSYSLTASQLNAAQYGVPQARERVFVVGQREGVEFRFPQPTHALPPKVAMAQGGIEQAQIVFPDLEESLTAWDAIGHLPQDNDPALRVRGKWAELLSTIPEGQNYLFHTDRGQGQPIFGWRRRYWSMLLKLAKARPSWTLTAQPGPAIGPFHWQNRRLSAAELACLQTFPSGYKIVGSVLSAHRQLGNAVPSALVERIGLSIRQQFFADHEAGFAPLTLLPQRRRPIPPPETPARRLPQQYLDMVGDHEPHPGTGKGPGAVARVD